MLDIGVEEVAANLSPGREEARGSPQKERALVGKVGGEGGGDDEPEERERRL